MEEIYLLGVDVGTSSIKVTVIDQEARFVAQESAAYRLINPNQVVSYTHLTLPTNSRV